MDLTNFSLIYPDIQSAKEHYDVINRPKISMLSLEELGILDAIDLKNSRLTEFFTTNKDVIEYRLETFSDMLSNEQLSSMLIKLIPLLDDIMELRRLEADSGEASSYLSSLTEIELYIASINLLYGTLSQVKDNLKSRAYLTLAEKISGLVESEYFMELNAKLRELSNSVREIKSVTIGVNLDSQLRPESAGVLSVNPENFRSGDTLEKILRFNFSKDQYTCIANLVPFGKKQSENQKMALSLAFNSAINDVYKTSLRSWKKIIQSYVLDNTEFLLNLLPEIEFLTKSTNMMRELTKLGNPLCRPEIKPMAECSFEAYDLYNPCVALVVNYPIVTNDLVFDENASIYVLTGPNRGGKSVITCALGLAQVMLQLGMYLPAKSIKISPVDAIYTHFPTGAEDTIDKGRLGEECARLGEIFEEVTAQSLVLLDESLSATGSYEASYIAAEVLRGLSKIGCKCLFSTHLHELAGEIDEINAQIIKFGGGKIDTLVAGIETHGVRSFKIQRTKPRGKSYAKDIAEKYGLTYDSILEKFSKRKG